MTSRDFKHFWLNEGFTVKLERRILREIYGRGREGLDAYAGRQTMTNYMKAVGEQHPNTRLVVELEDGADPDDAFSIVPYEKGYNFLLYLEDVVQGGDYNRTDFDGRCLGSLFFACVPQVFV